MYACMSFPYTLPREGALMKCNPTLFGWQDFGAIPIQTTTTTHFDNAECTQQIHKYILDKFSDLNDAKETTQQQVHKTHIWHL